MTTKTNDIVETEPGAEVPQETRSPEYLVDHFIKYADMTEEEIASVIEYKANLAIRDEEFKQKVEAFNKAEQEKIEILRENADKTYNDFKTLLDKALNNEQE